MTQVRDIGIDLEQVTLRGLLGLEQTNQALVIFAHGSGSSRLSSRNNYVAEVIRQHGMGTLLFDLLTEKEDEVYEKRFEIPLLSDRLIAVTQWLKNEKQTSNLRLGYFGASTGAAAALQAAAQLPQDIKAVVSRGGRPDMAGDDALARVQSPTLLIVGGHDDIVIDLNQQAFASMTCTKALEIVPGATHLFEEPGTLEQVAEMAARWFESYLS